MKHLIHQFFGLIFTIILLTTCSHATEKMLVITHSYNRPSFIEIQHKTFKKFLTDDYEFVVFNDARDEANERAIRNICAQLNIRCWRVPQEMHGKRQHSCERCADVVQYSLNVMGFDHDGIVMIIDSDMFLIKKLSVKEHLNGYDLAGCKQTRGPNHEVIYPWNGLVFMNMKTIPHKKSMNFDCGHVLGHPVDVGGQLHHYLLNNDAKVRWFNDHLRFNYLPENPQASLRTHIYPINDFLIDFMIKYPVIHGYSNDMELHGDGNFLHYRAGGNWQNYTNAYHIEKEQLLASLIDTAMNQ